MWKTTHRRIIVVHMHISYTQYYHPEFHLVREDNSKVRQILKVFCVLIKCKGLQVSYLILVLDVSILGIFPIYLTKYISSNYLITLSAIKQKLHELYNIIYEISLAIISLWFSEKFN